MFELEKTFHFEAGHQLCLHDGKCSNPHGHSYILTVHVSTDQLIPNGPKKNMVIDFSDISDIVKPMLKDYFDHKWLNDTLQSDSTTVEYMAKWIFDFLEPKLPGLHAVSLYETATARAIYRKNK